MDELELGLCTALGYTGAFLATGSAWNFAGGKLSANPDSFRQVNDLPLGNRERPS